MERLFKLIDWIKKETWWRKHYKRVEKTPSLVARNGRCPYCDAGDASPNKRCDIFQGRDCPCKGNQILINK